MCSRLLQLYSPDYTYSFYHRDFALLAVTHTFPLQLLLPVRAWKGEPGGS